MASKKVTINLPDDEIKFLKDMAARHNITFTDALRRSIKTEKFFDQQEADGRKILIEDQDKRIHTVMRTG